MTTGAKIGIGTGSAALVVIVIATAYTFRRRRRRHAQRMITPPPALDQTGLQDKPKLDDLNLIHEAEGWQPPELLATENIVHELQGISTV